MNSKISRVASVAPVDEARIRDAIAAWHAGESLDAEQQAVIDRLLTENYDSQIVLAASGAA